MRNFSLLASPATLDVMNEELTEHDMEILKELGVDRLSEGDIWSLVSCFSFVSLLFTFLII